MRFGYILLWVAFVFAAVSCGAGERDNATLSQRLTAYSAATMPEDAVRGDVLITDVLAELEATPVPDDVDGDTFNLLRDELARQLEACGVSKVALTPPTDADSQVPDLTVAYTEDGDFELKWRYYSEGDYNQNGQVAISDITPIAQYFGRTWPPGGENTLAAVIDGSGNHKVDIADITDIAQNFNCKVAEYAVEAATEEGGAFTEISVVPFEEHTTPELARASFATTLPQANYTHFRVVPRDDDGARGIESVAAAVPPRVLAVSPLAVPVGVPTTLTAQVIGAPPFEYDWGFAEGVTPLSSEEEAPEVTIGEAGDYECSVYVSSAAGEHTFDFTLSAGHPPVIVTVVSLNGSPDEEATAHALVSGTAPISYTWDFGGGANPNLSYEESPVVNLGLKGDYIGTLMVENAFGADTGNFSIHVTDSWWHVEVVDNEGDVGTDTSVAFDGDGNPSIAYHDQGQGNLKYAHFNGTGWEIETVDDAGTVGWYASLAFDGDGYPAIAHYDFVDQDLKLSWWNGAAWDLRVVDSEGNVGAGASLLFLNNGYPAVSYYDDTNEMLKYAEWNGAAWDFTSIAEGGGYASWNYSAYTSMRLDGGGNPAIAFYRAITGVPLELFLATWDGSSWSVQTVVTGVQDVFCTTMAFDAAGYPVLSYFDSDIPYLTWWNGVSWDQLPVDTVLTLDYRAAVVFDSTGKPMVATYGNSDGQCHLGFSLWTGLEWYTGVIDDSSEVVGKFLSLALGPGDTVGAAYYDMTNQDLKFAWYY